MRWLWPSTCLLTLCSGCYYYPYPNSAVFNPWTVAPSSAQRPWVPPPEAKQHLAPLALMMPQEDQQPMTLAEVVNIALNNNPQTQITWAQARQAAAYYAETQAPQFPTINGNFTFEQGLYPNFDPNQVNVFLITQNYIQYAPQLQLAYTVWDFGQMRATSEAARQALYYSNWTHNRAIQTVIQTVSVDYYNFLFQKALYEAYLEDVRTAQTTFDVANASFQAGVKDIADVLQAKTQLLQSQTQWIQQQQSVETAYTALIKDMGLPSHLNFRLQEWPKVIASIDNLPDINELVTTALQQRADLIAAEANLKSSEENIRSVRAQFWPTLTYNFEIGRTYFLRGQHDDYDYSNVVALDIPLFSGLSTLNTLRQAKAQKQQAKALLRQTELQVIQDITTAHSGVKVSYETLDYAKHFLESAQQQYEVELAKYKAGTNTILDVVTAQDALAQARATQASSIQQWYSSLSTLAYAAGILSESTVKKEELQ